MVQLEAVYRNGAFEPLDPTNLPENQRVRLTVEEVELSDAQEWLARARRRHAQMIAENRILPDSTPDIAADRLRSHRGIATTVTFRTCCSHRRTAGDY